MFVYGVKQELDGIRWGDILQGAEEVKVRKANVEGQKCGQNRLLASKMVFRSCKTPQQ